ncbi:MAG: Holliday junction branch migration protein RuvA [Lachnospiraceae bacterium]|nr:Holliday junction branch migration protein RuvA [Lachnospiraceae bacterium]
MIYFVRGELAEISEDWVVLDCQGIGYQIRIPASSAGKLPPAGCEVTIYTHMSVREDAVSLYGFLSRDERDIFKMLITVSGVGPKVGLGILSALPPDDLRFAVLSEDVKAISEAPGVGKKTAQKLILELKDKMKLRMGERREEPAFVSGAARGDGRDEAVEALTALGYSPSEAMKAVRSAEAPGDASAEEFLKLALRNLSGM